MIRPRLRLRTKLLLVTLALLGIPWAGYRYVREMDGFLRHAQESTLLGTARAVATVLDDRPRLMTPRPDLVRALREDRDLYAYPLKNPIQLDGYAEDWSDYLDRALTYGPEHRLAGSGPPDSLSFRNLVGVRGSYLYALFLVRDDHRVYRAPDSLRLDQSDHLIIALQDPAGRFHRYLLTTRAPGWVNAYEVDAAGHGAPHPEVRIQGEWQETPGGYTVELRIPETLVGNKLAFAVADVDDPRRRTVREVIGTAGVTTVAALGTVMTPSPRIQAILRGLSRANARLWVVNRQGRVLALTGSLRPPPDETLARNGAGPRADNGGLLNLIYRLVLRQPTDQFDDALAGASRLQGSDVQAALAGHGAVRWRHTPHARAVILSAAYPIHDGGTVAGAVVAEQTGNAILTLRNRAMVNLFNVTLVVFAAATLALVLFASRLSGRIRRLRNQLDAAIGPDGRVQPAAISGRRAGDELGDLARGVDGVLQRLAEYTRYLEGMAGRLSHELRTPLTVVRSSLENLEHLDLPAQSRPYITRAREGLDRLGTILTRLSEATRLEQALQQAERERFDLAALVSGCTAGYRDAYPRRRFEADVPAGPVMLTGVPDLLAQLLDKLVANAMDFGPPDRPVRIALSATPGQAVLEVINDGPPLPAGTADRLFESLVSLREDRGDSPHLGLGLYIVRLIAQFHGGHARAENREDGAGVVFRVTLPRD